MRNRKLYVFGFLFLAFAVSCDILAPAPVATVPPAVSPTAATRTPTPAGSTLAPGEIAVTIVPGRSEARYRVREQLVGINLPSDAVGVTQDVAGTIVGKMDGTIVSAKSKFQVDLRTLRSDEGRRDNFLRNNTLETNRFPFAVFVPIEVRGATIPPPTSGNVKFQLVGDMTIRNVTKPVVWDVDATLEGNEGTALARTSFNFAHFNLVQPRVPMVLSIEDNIRLEVELFMRRE